MNTDFPQVIRVLHIISSLDCGGTETRLMELLRKFQGEKAHFDFLVHHNRDAYYTSEAKSYGAGILYCGSLKNIVFFSIRFYRLLKSSNYDVVHSHVLAFSAVCLFIAKLAGIKVRAAHFRYTYLSSKRHLFEFISNKILTFLTKIFATDIIGISKGVLKVWFGEKWSTNPKIKLVYDGIDTAPYRKSYDVQSLKREFKVPLNHKLIVHVGSFIEAKNHRKLVGAAKIFIKGFSDACFVLVGEGVLKNEIKALVIREGIEDKFRFVGLRRDVPRILKCSDVFLFPSLWEGLGNVLIEAIAAGLPIIASDIAIFRETFDICGHAILLPVAAPDGVWANEIAESLSLQKTDYLDQLEKSCFSVEKSWESLQQIYSGRKN